MSRFKNDIATEMAAVLAFSAITNNDKVGAILFLIASKISAAQKGKQNILRIIRELINLTPGQRNTNLSEALIYLNNIQKKRSITFILSDFMTEDYDQALTIASKNMISSAYIFMMKGNRIA